MAAQDEAKTHADQGGPHRPYFVQALTTDGQFRGLELRVKIEGRDHTILLSPDALEANGLSGSEAVAELRKIRGAIDSSTDRLARPIDNLSKSTAALASAIARTQIR